MDIIKQFNLPSYLKGKSFSEASALIAKKFEGRSSPEDEQTLNELQGRLQQAQEFVKAEQEKRTKPQQVATNPANAGFGAEPTGSEPASNQFFLGGLTSMLGGGAAAAGGAAGGAAAGAGGAAGGGIGSLLGSGAGAAGAGAGGYVGAATTAIDLAKTAFGPTGIDTSGRQAAPAVPSQGAAAASGAMKGAQAGMAFGPWGAAIGGVVGGVSGLVGGKKAQNEANKASVAYDENLHNKATNDYKSGGHILANMFVHGGEHNTDPYAETENLIAEMRRASNQGKFAKIGVDDVTLDAEAINDKIAELDAFSNTMPDYRNAEIGAEVANSIEQGSINEDTNKKPATKFNPGELLRYAPAAMNIAQLANLKKPEQVGYDKLGNRYNEQLVDERGLQNMAQESVLNTRDAILGSSGGSGSTARANLLASQLQGGKVLSQAYMGAGAENRQEKRKAQEFNLGVDSANLGQSNKETDTNLQLQAAYQTNKSKLLSQLGDDLGGVGKEELFKRYPELMGLSYGSRGEHLASKKKKKA